MNALNATVTAHTESITNLNSIASGFTGERAIKDYIDNAVANATMNWGTI